MRSKVLKKLVPKPEDGADADGGRREAYISFFLSFFLYFSFFLSFWFLLVSFGFFFSRETGVARKYISHSPLECSIHLRATYIYLVKNGGFYFIGTPPSEVIYFGLEILQ